MTLAPNLDRDVPVVGESGPGYATKLRAVDLDADAVLPVSARSRGAVATGGNDSSGLQDAILDAIASAAPNGTAVVRVPKGLYLASDLEIPEDEPLIIDGDGPSATQLVLRPGANSFLLGTEGWDSLVGTDNPGGNVGVSLRNLALLGNKDLNPSAGDLVRLYGRRLTMEHVDIGLAKGRGLVTEWSADLGAPDQRSMESVFTDVKVYGCDGGGVYNNGPHDSRWNGGEVYQNEGVNYEVGPLGHGTQLTDWHSWGEPHNIGFKLGATGCRLNSCQGEGASGAGAVEVLVLANDCRVDGRFYQPNVIGLINTGVALSLGDASTEVAGTWVAATFENWGSAINWVGDVGNNYVMAKIYQTIGPEYLGTPNIDTVRMIMMGGRVGQTSDFHVKGRATFPEGMDVTGNLSVTTNAGFQVKVITSDPSSNRAEVHFLHDTDELFVIGTDRDGDGGHNFFVYDSVFGDSRLLVNENGVVGMPYGIGVGSAGFEFPGSAGAQTGWLIVCDHFGVPFVKIPAHALA